MHLRLPSSRGDLDRHRNVRMPLSAAALRPGRALRPRGWVRLATPGGLRSVLLGGSALAGLALAAAPLVAQDVEMLGRIHGTRPPASYYELLERDPSAFTFDRAWMGRNPRLREVLPPGGDLPFDEAAAGGDAQRFGGGWRAIAADGGRASGSGPAAIGPRDEPVVGTVRVPLLLGYFLDDAQAPLIPRSRVQEHFFESNPTGTITELYAEMSGGRVNLVGETRDWVRSTLTADEVTGGVSGLGGSSRIGEFVMGLVEMQSGVDWGRYDNDGPDGEPNSGDDDGFVDVVAVIHPVQGAECGGPGQDDRIWSHKWSLRSATGQHKVTTTPSADGGFIKVNDYTVQPVYSCDAATINEIGVLAHELGHGFGLPDLYDTSGRHGGVGRWGLMGSGSWGCVNREPEWPCSMNAWSRSVLGWVEVVDLTGDVDRGVFTFEPVHTGKVYRVDVPDSDEYFLIENRQRQGFDRNLPSEGLLIWRIDDGLVTERWPANAVNADVHQMGVWLVQADGRDDLGAREGGNRGDGGDPWPGSGGRTAFHAATSPAARTFDGDPGGLTLQQIEHVGDDVVARLHTGFRALRVRAEGEGAQGSTLHGSAVSGLGEIAVRLAPFDETEVAAGAGAALDDGVRVAFSGWADGATARTRTVVMGTADSTLVADYAGRELRVRATLEGGQTNVPPGAIELEPAGIVDADGHWVAPGPIEFRVQAATGFTFAGWGGALAGQTNPASLDVSAPVDVKATFDQTYGVVSEARRQLEAGREHEVVLQADGGVGAIEWFAPGGDLPDGLELAQNGRLTGAPLETGTFEVGVLARDSRGLEATATLVLDVVAPVIGVHTLTGPFLLAGSTPSPTERAYLDRQGNANGVYDLGDLRRFLLANPGLPMTAAERDLVRMVVPMVGFDGPAVRPTAHDGGGR